MKTKKLFADQFKEIKREQWLSTPQQHLVPSVHRCQTRNFVARSVLSLCFLLSESSNYIDNLYQLAS